MTSSDCSSGCILKTRGADIVEAREAEMIHPPAPTFAVIFVLVLLGAVAVPAGHAQVCGDGVIEPPEECDDGRSFRLDGCAPDCTFEHVQRLTLLELGDGTAPVSCTPTTNAFGAAFTGFGLAAVNAQIASEIAAGNLNQLLQFISLDDPAAIDDPALEIGVLGSDPDPRGPTSGLDAWYLAMSRFLAGDDLPLLRLPGAVAGRELSAGPGRIEIGFLTGTIVVKDARVAATVGPVASLPGPPPDEFAFGFAAFEGLQANDGNHGLCGNLTVGSLAAMPLPAEFTSGGGAACSSACAGSRDYTWCGDGNPVGPGCNSTLDLLVSGCAVSPPLCVALINPTQPDVGTGGQAPAVLVPDPGTGKVTVTEPDDAYSTWFEFAAERAHITNKIGGIFADGFESADLGSWSSANPL